MENISTRIKQYADIQRISIRQIETKIGASNGVISNSICKNTDIQSKWLSKIIEYYPDINPTWLLTGNGEMIVGEKKYAEMSDNTHLNIASDHKPAYNSDLVAYLERKLDEKTRECYDLQAKIEGLVSELRARNEADAQGRNIANAG